MSKYITQIRYYGDGDERNSSKDVSSTSLVKGTIFRKYSPITQLGIQTSPTFEYMEGDTKKVVRPSFYVNGGADSVQIGRTGIYELDLDGIGSISSLALAQDFITAIIECNKQGGQAHVMIDLVYEK